MSSDRNLRKVLGFDPDYERQCVGISKSYRNQPRCKNPVSVAHRQEASYLLNQMDRSKSAIPEFSDLQELAGLMLCQRWHLNQTNEVALRWKATIKKENDLAVKRKEREEREARERSLHELARIMAKTNAMIADLEEDRPQIPTSNNVRKLTTKIVPRKPAFEVFRDEPAVTASNSIAASEQQVPLTREQQHSREPVANSQVQGTDIESTSQTQPSSTILQSSIFPPTPDATPSPQHEVSTVEHKGELPSTPTKPIKATKQQQSMAGANAPSTPPPLTPESFFSFGDSSRQTTPAFDFGFTPVSAVGRNQPLTPPSSIKSENIFGPLLASQDKARFLAPDSTPTPQRSDRVPLGSKSTSTHNKRHMKEPVSPISKIKKDNKLPLGSFNSIPQQPFTHVSVTEIFEGDIFGPGDKLQKQMELKMDEVNEKRILEDSPTIPDDCPKPSHIKQASNSVAKEPLTPPKYILEKPAVVLDQNTEDSVSYLEFNNKILSEDEGVSEDEDKENKQPVVDKIIAPIPTGKTVYHEPELEAPSSMTTDVDEESFGYATVISTTTTSYRTSLPRRKSLRDSSSNRFAVIDFRNRAAVTYDFVPSIARKPLPATPLPAPQSTSALKSEPEQQIQSCEICGRAIVTRAGTCNCFDEAELKEELVPSGCLASLGLRRLKEKVVKKLKEKSEKRR